MEKASSVFCSVSRVCRWDVQLCTCGIRGSDERADILCFSTGSDANDGSAGAPWKTLGKASATMQPGDTCVVRGGTYHETLKPGSGVEGARHVQGL